jgi:hypothetical protein
MTKQQVKEENPLSVLTEEFGVRQAAEGTQEKETNEIMEKSIAYMNGETIASLSEEVRENCQNRNELCAFWSAIGVSVVLFLLLSGPVQQVTNLVALASCNCRNAKTTKDSCRPIALQAALLAT